MGISGRVYVTFGTVMATPSGYIHYYRARSNGLVMAARAPVTTDYLL